jgi:hypothetical protein
MIKHPLVFATILIIFLSFSSQAQYSKYDVIDYFRLIPIGYFDDNFLDFKVTDQSSLEAIREKILKNGIIDVGNGYISQEHNYIPELLNEFTVWKSKDKKDVIGISTRLNFLTYFSNTFDRAGYTKEYGIRQNLYFYTYENGIFNLTDYFMPNGNSLIRLAKKKYPDLKNNPQPNLVYLLPRYGTKVRIVNYVLPKVKIGKIIIRDVASLIWTGTELKFSEKP